MNTLLNKMCADRMKAGEAKYETCWCEVDYIPECIEEVVDAINYIRGASNKAEDNKYKFKCYSIEADLKKVFKKLIMLKQTNENTKHRYKQNQTIF